MKINVTKTFFPPLEEYNTQLKRIWANKWLTNRGELVVELEGKIKAYLNSDDLIIMNNGTIPLQIALKLLGNGGEVITTPFSYVATTSAIIWENCTPVFVDIHPEYLTIDETKIEAAITDKTTCILATHVFGNPCNVEVIEQIAKKYNLYVIYDAAHCFGVEYLGKSIFNYGDISTCSFHATKLFHTGEGGALFTSNKELFHKAFYSHNFGHNGPLDFYGLGINGKISELQAAMGLCVLPHMPEILDARKAVVDFYDQHLNFDSIKKLQIRPGTKWNYSYYPILFDSEKQLLACLEKLNSNTIFPRRYFYPSLNNISFINGMNMQISNLVASQIICLPLSTDIDCESLQLICSLIS
jgi:dTDP-4-amino-4,6-dideoxygalactose transaminase